MEPLASWLRVWDWASGGVARLAYDYQQIGESCVAALERAGYSAEFAPEHVSGIGFAFRFRHWGRRHLCPALEKAPRDLDGWEPWSCDLERGHTGPHHNALMGYRWADDPDVTAPGICGAWAHRGIGCGLGACTLPAGHSPTLRHRDTLDE
ncbi:hypothetical protein [Streptomyces sp. NPDC093097]|uniref:hypothetical protein n=1 Tax=Streptomyces sp. NPDC093097 TaxID=3366027 RepID=UPI0037F34FB7